MLFNNVRTACGIRTMAHLVQHPVAKQMPVGNSQAAHEHSSLCPPPVHIASWPPRKGIYLLVICPMVTLITTGHRIKSPWNPSPNKSILQNGRWIGSLVCVPWNYCSMDLFYSLEHIIWLKCTEILGCLGWTVVSYCLEISVLCWHRLCNLMFRASFVFVLARL